ncbi:MAG: hypothetical protein QF886_08170 [Planctomycetota bacterium]|nr:hypothetical protein [Planctomycetota bacterium]
MASNSEGAEFREFRRVVYRFGIQCRKVGSNSAPAKIDLRWKKGLEYYWISRGLSMDSIRPSMLK